jgi:hypothetical protein
LRTHLNALKALLPLIVIATLLLGLTACKPQEIKLSFETIEQVDATTKQWEGKEPKLLVIASTQDVEAARPFVTDEALAALQKMDYTTHFAVLAFRGLQTSSHEGFKVEQIGRQGNEVLLYAQPGANGPDAVMTSPYHLIEVNKEGQWGGNFTFNLYFDQAGAAAASTTHHVP